jgi:flagella basal body P-ring formation protein FlgA
MTLCFGTPTLAGPTQGSEAEPVVVTLRAVSSVSDTPLCIQHVATLSGGSSALRERIAGLDLANPLRRGGSQTILRQLISYRIQLAGIGPTNFRVEGPTQILVKRSAAPLTEADFLNAARDALLVRCPYRAEDLKLSLAQPLDLESALNYPPDRVRLEAVVRPPINLPGQVQVDVSILVDSERKETVSLALTVQVYQFVAVTLRRIEADEPLNEENVRLEQRPIDVGNSFVTAKDLRAGQRSRVAMNSGQTVLHAHVEPLTTDNPILVKSRELIKLTARVGSLRVTTKGEAQQDGRAGEKIRVRNVDSKKEIVGRVVERGLVEVEY